MQVAVSWMIASLGSMMAGSVHGCSLEDPVITEIAEGHGKSPAQVMLRWHLQRAVR
jgi:diketogulonate reductase-like aldo/keto reductase